MKKILKLTGCIAIMLLQPFHVRAQQVSERMLHALNQEWITLHQSKPFYTAGERVWYNVQLQGEATKNAQSKLVYITLSGVKGKVILEQKLVLQNRQASGDFLLPDSLKSGYYQLSAFTAWSKNFGPSQTFQKQVLVLNSSSTRQTVNSGRRLEVKFYPEGGSLLAETRSKLGVEVGIGGTAVSQAQVILMSETDSIIADTQTNEQGLAIFNFTPRAGQEYTAVVSKPGTPEVRVSLPKAEANGAALYFVRQTEAEIFLTAVNKTADHFSLIAVQKGKLVHSQSIQGTGAVTIQKDKLTAGQVQVLLLDNLRRVVAYRYLNVEKKAALQANIQTDKKIYTPREPVTLKVSLKDNAGKTVDGNFSVSVFAMQPVWEKSLDDLLLTHPEDVQLTEAIRIGQPKLMFEPEFWVDPLLQQPLIQQKQTAAPIDPIKGVNPFELPLTFQQYLAQDLKRKQIMQIYGAEEFHTKSAAPKPKADKVYFMEDYLRLDNMEEVLKSIVSNVRVKKQKEKRSLRILYTDNTSRKYFFNGDPLLLIDGVIVQQVDELLALPVQDVSSIEVLWGEATLANASLGEQSGDGVIAVYTKSGEVAEALKAKGNSYLYQDYYFPHLFTTTAYDLVDVNYPVFASQLFWTPSLKATAAESVEISFYTSDETGFYKVVIQGITEAGDEFINEAIFEVKSANQ